MTVLAVAPPSLQRRIEEALPAATVIPAASPDEAANLLAATAFDLVVVADEAAGDEALSVIRTATERGAASVFVAEFDAERAGRALRYGARCVPAGHEALLQAVLTHEGGASRSEEPSGGGGTGREAQLRHVVLTLSGVYHDLNNPLAIIAGNAQYYRELAGAMGVAEELTAPVADIEAATEKMGPIIERLQALKREVLASLESKPDVRAE